MEATENEMVMKHDELPEGYKPTNTIEVIAGAGRKYEQTKSMIHDELLANLTPTQERGFPSNPISVLTALRAVVELCNKWETKGSYCLPIEDVIKAIEKELR